MLNLRSSMGKIHFSIQVTVVSVFIFATFLTAIVALSLQYHFSLSLSKDNIEQSFRHFGEDVGRALKQFDTEASSTVRILAKQERATSLAEFPKERQEIFGEFLRANSMFYSIYVGFDDGDMFQLINLDSAPIIRKSFAAEAEDRWILSTVTDVDGQRLQQLNYMNDTFELRHSKTLPSSYFANKRLWYQQARQDSVHKTEPYQLRDIQASGQTYSLKTATGKAVFGVAILIDSIQEYFERVMDDEHMQAFIFHPSGNLVTSINTHYEIPPLASMPPLNWSAEEQAILAKYPRLKVSNERSWSPIDFSISGIPKGYSIDFLTLMAQAMGVQLSYVNGVGWNDILSLFAHQDIDMLQSTNKSQSNESLGLFSTPYLDLPYLLVTNDQQPEIYNIASLYGKTIAIPAGWTIIKYIKQAYPQIQVIEVDSTASVLRAVASGEVFGGIDSGAVLQYEAANYFIQGLKYQTQIDLRQLGVPSELHLVLQPQYAELMPIVNRAISAVNERYKSYLTGRWISGTWGQETSTTVPYAQIIKMANSPQQLGTLQQFKEQNKEFFIYVTSVDKSDSYQHYLALLLPRKQLLADALQRILFSLMITFSMLILLSPLSWLFSSPIVLPIKRLADESSKIKQRQYDQVAVPSSRIIEIDELGQSIAEMSLSIQQQERSQQELLDAFIQLIAQAIDYKSPYTAGHCLRVPELALMMVRRANASNEAPFADFSFTSDKEWREFKVGAWLHDCGKIITPEHIVDKGSKLETIYNRIHEVRMRFEVLLRDADIDFYKQVANQPEKQAELAQQREQKRAQLIDDFEFVAKCNVGDELLSERDKIRLKQIATQKWTRNLSDRLGLSPLEERIYSEVSPTEILPVQEPLLADKLIHKVPRHHSVEYPEHLGIKMEVPTLLYNHGELHNLMIERGTLTAEDRFKINEHIISTIQMLDNLPFPADMAKVPRYASTHHETLDGRGYPRKLMAEQLSIPERIMVLADIFEALTASDRPYKKAKTVSGSIKILYQMVKDGHVDADVFKLFLSSGIYLEYARRYLDPSQIDLVDIERYMDAAWQPQES
ncbi:transporter substrate-binding domain-containing protein [Shewanella avicenniae]|uniref:Transporter substrate-binding domain-containing protein n=1 Tax=Shewanella avicenniae TaxID=2814294 RepID=A0ABX7QUA0_9GAMM|nr:HD domain-containing phosphohydrolase [Shewanella avicenniae]QSX34423.1 transporter substrate-binding domain-containing protein [Shewanella avicenniae]